MIELNDKYVLVLNLLIVIVEFWIICLINKNKVNIDIELNDIELFVNWNNRCFDLIEYLKLLWKWIRNWKSKIIPINLSD